MRALILFFLILNLNVNAQNKKVLSQYENKKIAVEKGGDSIFFYNNSGNLIRLIDLKTKKSTQYDLPIEVQNVIFFGNPQKKRGDLNTFPTYLYSSINNSAGPVLCKTKLFYNELGLKTGYIESCPDDSGGGGYLFGKEKMYEYNDFGQLTTIKGDTIREYDNNGNMIKFFRRNYFSGKVVNIYKYHYSDNRLVKKEYFDTEYKDTILESVSRYKYDAKERLELIKNFSVYKGIERYQSSFLFSYNSKGLIHKIEKTTSENKKILLEIKYDEKSRINYFYIFPHQKYEYEYNEKNNLISISNKGKIINTFKYNSTDRLIYSYNGWSEETSYLKYK